MSSTDSRPLRDAYGSFMSGVTVVTAYTPDNTPVGFTANSFASVSLDPPLLLVCPSRELNCFDVFNQCTQFAVSVLAEDQREVSNIFASTSNDRFAQVRWFRDSKGNPVISDAAAVFSCDVSARHDGGDHIILVGEVQDYSMTNKLGLGYSAGSYFSLGLERQANELLTPTQSAKVGAIAEYQGRILMQQTTRGLQPPTVTATHRTGSLSAIREHLVTQNIDVAFGPVYSIFENMQSGVYTTFYRGEILNFQEQGVYRLYSPEELATAKYADVAVGDLMKRYLIERSQGVFTQHSGDERKGKVQSTERGG